MLLVGANLFMTPLLMLMVALLLGVLLYRNAWLRPPNFPPGPPRLPVWGSLWLLFLLNYRYFHLSLLNMARRYKTKVMGFYLGPFACVVACDHDSVNELLRRPEFQARPDLLIARVRSFGGRYGIVFSDGPEWVEQRQFFLRQMRDFGFGRRYESFEAVVGEEVTDLVDLLYGNWKDEFVVKRGSVNLSHLFAPYCLNALWYIFGGERFPRESHQALHSVSQTSTEFMKTAESTGRAVSLTPWLKNLSPGGFGVKAIHRISDEVKKFVKKSIDEHRSNFDEDNMRDYIDVYLKKMKNENDTLPEIYNENQLTLTGIDMVMATSTALVGSLTVLFHCLLHYPEVQKKIQAELDEVVGRGRLATLDDRQRMPYLEATLRESMRRMTLFVMSIPHFCTEDTHFQGYSIPKNTIMYANLYAAHMDSEVWGDPENFRPERFLDDNGLLKKKDLSTPFGAGKRLCTGETFSRQLMFQITAGLMQNFNFVPVDSTKLPPLDDLIGGFALTARDVYAKVIPRN